MQTTDPFSFSSVLRASLVVVLLGGLATGLPARAQEVTVSTFGQYSRGDYIFTDRTDVFAWTNDLSVVQGRVRVGASVPLLVQSEPWVSYTGVGPAPSGGPQHGSVGGGHATRRGRRPIAIPDTISYRTTGLGDPQVRLTVDLVRPGTRGFGVQLTGAVKPPLADTEAGFSTGAWDGGLGMGASRSFAPWVVLVEGAYWWLGDLDDLPLENGITFSVAVGRTVLGGRWGLLASIAGSTPIIEDVDPPLSVTGGVRFSPGRWGLSATAGSGLSEGAADWSVGLGGHVTFRD